MIHDFFIFYFANGLIVIQYLMSINELTNSKLVKKLTFDVLLIKNQLIELSPINYVSDPIINTFKIKLFIIHYDLLYIMIAGFL